METTDLPAWLEQKGIKPTANRLLVLKALRGAIRPMCLADLEDTLGTMDKSSISRVLALLLEHNIIHSFEDGRGVLNYELCTSKGLCDQSDAHIHFYCETCHKSYCMKDIPLSSLELPEGFTPYSISFVIKGECPACKKLRSQ